MHILTLPLEILDLILHHSITSRGFPRALRLKLVCSKSNQRHPQSNRSHTNQHPQNHSPPPSPEFSSTPKSSTTPNGALPFATGISAPTTAARTSSGTTTSSFGVVTSQTSRSLAMLRFGTLSMRSSATLILRKGMWRRHLGMKSSTKSAGSSWNAP